jgi:hypothetical protein
MHVPWEQNVDILQVPSQGLHIFSDCQQHVTNIMLAIRKYNFEI